MSAMLVGAVLLLPALLVLSADPGQAATTRTLAITTASARPTVPFALFDGAAPKLFDIDGDGDREVIAQNDNQWVYVFDSRTGALLSELRTTLPSGWGARSINAPEVAILSGDGKVHVVLANSAATVTSYTYDPAANSGGRLAFKKDWERRLTDCHASPGMDSKPVLADLDKDGRLEILAATEESGVFALRADGSVYWKKCIGGGNAEPVVGDINLDSWPDVVFGSDGGIVTAMNGRTGVTMWGFNVHSRFNVGSGSMPVGVSIGQLDGAGGLEVVAGARDSHDATNFENDHAVLFALGSGGGFLWGKQDANGGNPLTYTHPIIVDAAKDGQAEVYWADWNTIGHKPGNWETTGPANFYRYDKSGNLVWKQTLSTFWNNKDVPLADVDADGVQEMLANGPGTNGHDGIWYLDTRNGAKESWVDLYPYKLNRAPVVGDLYGNGRMQWVAQVSAFASGGAHGILIYDTGSPYSSAWPHLPDPARGTGGGTSTSSSTTGTTTSSSTSTTSSTTTSTSSGNFAAAFSVPAGVNEWWVEVAVSANQPLQKVEAQANGGAWTALTKQGWGNWAKSFQVPAGSSVVFRATSTSGAAVDSQAFNWLNGGSGGGGGPFTATFTPKAVGNDWWVEVDVGANQPLSGVQAQVNSGAWTPLAKQSWGSWAKSMPAPNGSQVTFRALNATGIIVTSQPTTWT